MLTKIREKTQGTFAWVILILICVPFALWGLQNYTTNPQETAVVIVGDREFSQQEVNQSYATFKQQYAEMKLPEEILKKQAIEKLIRDELLWQHVAAEKLAVTDETVRKFIATLQYFQRDGRFDKKQYESLLGAQGMTSVQFANRIRKALVMEQYQKAVTDSSFVPEQNLARFFTLQNQTRDIEYVTVKVQAVTEKPSKEEIEAYYQQHADAYQSVEKVSVEYVELDVDSLMNDIEPTAEQIQNYYEDNIDLYSKKERRKISHILFAKNKETTEAQALEKANAARARLKAEKFTTIAKELSDDKLTAKNGGDLGLFEVGVMEPEFEKAAESLRLGEVSEPVKSAFGYHLITVTELVPAKTKSLDEVKAEVILAVKKAEAETTFYELGETLTELSFENSDNLTTVAEDLGLDVQNSKPFSITQGEGIAAEKSIRNMAFSDSVLKGNNSEPIELNDSRLIVLRLLDHQPAEAMPLSAVQDDIVVAIQTEKAQQKAEQTAKLIKQKLIEGNDFKTVAMTYALNIQERQNLKRDSSDLAWQMKQAVFKAAKPIKDQATVIIVDGLEGAYTVIKLLAVNDGVAEVDAEKKKLAQANIAKALGQTDYSAVIEGIRETTRVVVGKQ